MASWVLGPWWGQGKTYFVLPWQWSSRCSPSENCSNLSPLTSLVGKTNALFWMSKGGKSPVSASRLTMHRPDEVYRHICNNITHLQPVRGAAKCERSSLFTPTRRTKGQHWWNTKQHSQVITKPDLGRSTNRMTHRAQLPIHD